MSCQNQILPEYQQVCPMEHSHLHRQHLDVQSEQYYQSQRVDHTLVHGQIPWLTWPAQGWPRHRCCSESFRNEALARFFRVVPELTMSTASYIDLQIYSLWMINNKGFVSLITLECHFPIVRSVHVACASATATRACSLSNTSMQGRNAGKQCCYSIKWLYHVIKKYEYK